MFFSPNLARKNPTNVLLCSFVLFVCVCVLFCLMLKLTCFYLYFFMLSKVRLLIVV